MTTSYRNIEATATVSATVLSGTAGFVTAARSTGIPRRGSYFIRIFACPNGGTGSVIEVANTEGTYVCQDVAAVGSYTNLLSGATITLVSPIVNGSVAILSVSEGMDSLGRGREYAAAGCIDKTLVLKNGATVDFIAIFPNEGCRSVCFYATVTSITGTGTSTGGLYQSRDGVNQTGSSISDDIWITSVSGDVVHGISATGRWISPRYAIGMPYSYFVQAKHASTTTTTGTWYAHLKSIGGI